MQLHVGGLSDSANEDVLSVLFSGMGRVESVRVIRDITSGKSRGFALVRMPDNNEAEEAIKRLNGQMLDGRHIAVFRIHETLPGEMEFREWLRDNAYIVLQRIGIRQNQTVLDYGCGPGIFSIASARIVGRLGKVFALDVRPDELERLRETVSKLGLNNIETILADRSTVSVALENESVDVILLYDVLQEIADRAGLFRELHRVLRQDGLLSVFPMHLGTVRALEMLDAQGIFTLRDRYGVPGFQSASEVINFTKDIK